MRSPAPIILAVFVASAVLAHEGVSNPAVMARMEGMKQIGESMKVLGQMSKGAVTFDEDAARTAAATIAHHAGETPKLFMAHEDDPKSEALPAIWQDFADFTAKAEAMEAVALKQADAIGSFESLKAAVVELGSTCQSCHKAYRE